MPLLVPDVGEVVALNNLLNKVAPQDSSLILFQSNTTPAETDTTATYTEATFTGYAAKALTAANWTVTSGAPTSAAYPQQTWTSTANQASQSIYGYAVKQAVSGILLWAERFAAAPYAITNNGDAILVTPTITLD